MEPADGSSADLSGRREAHDSWKSERRQREAEQPTCTEFRKMEERITDMDVEEAVKKLTQVRSVICNRLYQQQSRVCVHVCVFVCVHLYIYMIV